MTRRLAIVPDSGLDEIGLPRDHLGDLTPNGRPRCKGIKNNGLRCTAFQGKRGFCFQHDPGITDAQRARARSRGGRLSRTAHIKKVERMLPPRLRSVFDRLENAMQEVEDGTMAPTRATALASLATAAVRVLEAGELEEKMRKMEEAAGGTDDYGDPTPTPDSDD